MYHKRILALSLFVFLAGVTPADVQQAQVTVQNLSTGVERVVKSDAGYYTVPSLQPGNYSVSIEAAGFAAYKLSSVTLQVDFGMGSYRK
jgi:hypothetical protein